MIKQVLIVGFICMIIMLFIIPINSTVLDVLIGINIFFAILLLLKALTTSSLVEFSSFPALLLISTLFRLAITVSSTRLILSEANAGNIIETFGEFVTRGNMVIGGVVFSIVTIVNFVVITKGSERIGEVSSRFFLDALPGKQISIDSDLKSGLISEAEAKNKRSLLDKEAQIFGSLDGTMKFVKGDAVAGLIIIFVNIFGGLAVGNLYHDMALSEAVSTFTLLTIGDGLVGQIPALIISIGAAIIVSRVMDETTESLEEQISLQLFGNLNILIMSAVCCVVLACIPGMPSVIFLILAVIPLIVGWFFRNTPKVTGYSDLDLLKSDIVIKLPTKYYSQAEKKQIAKDIETAVYEKFGIIITQPVIAHTQHNEFELMFQGYNVECPFSAMHFYNYSSDNNEGDDNTVANVLGQNIKISSDTSKTKSMQVILDWYKDKIFKNIKNNFGIQETKFLLDFVSISNFDLVNSLQQQIAIQKITSVLKRLLNEDIALLNIKEIFTALHSWSSKEEDELLLAELVRIEIKERICKKIAINNTIKAMQLCSDTSKAIDNAIKHSATGAYLELDPSFDYWLTSEVDRLSQEVNNFVILADTDIRRFVWSTINKDRESYKQIPVISFHELVKEIKVENMGTIKLKD
ncbi:flagellar biosynthesis protein FlhA [Aliivibrio fischeri]|uniref:flagellar biosynthesis protein FlhA n=1 Tax=Aliivibrio fischeri TaxID=668 RepID=UPI00166DF585|nr:flagellar biosynthesis protein FlhA [Aliivibrio fischeri]USR97956.1 flagellar biosynthesis protein FlhA [Aliivibrio fischeri ATCC 7744 = JCM 18803 = DSM 507]